MNLQSEKIRLTQMLLETDNEQIIKSVNEVFEKAKEATLNEIIGITTDGRPLTRKELIKGLELSEQQIKEGKVTNSEDLAKEIEGW